MEYIKFGSGRKNFVILPGLSVHPLVGAAEEIKKAFESFTEDYTVYLFDRPKTLPESCTVQYIADKTYEKMISLGIKKADFFGASQGGMMVLSLAVNHPDIVEKAVLASTLSRPNETFISVVNTWVKAADEKNEAALLESFADSVYSENTLKQYRDFLINSNKGITDEEFRRFSVLAKSCLKFDCYERLSEIKCSLFVIGAEGDRVTTPSGSREIAEKTGCYIHMYGKEYGHGVYDEASSFRSHISELLKMSGPQNDK